MKQLLTILIFIFALPLSDVFAQHNEPLPNAVLKMDAGYSIKGNKVTAIDKTTMSTKNTSIPSSQAVKTAINSAIATAMAAAELDTTRFYKINPISSELYTGITSLDTNTIRYGKILQNTSYKQIPYSLDSYTPADSINIGLNTNKSVYLDRVESTADFTYSGGYKLECDEKSNVNYYVNVWKNNGRPWLRFDCGKSNAASEKSSNVISVNRYESDSLLAVNAAYMATLHYFRKVSNKTILLKYNQMICNLASQLIYSGFNITNSSITFDIKEFFTKVDDSQVSVLASGDYGSMYGGNANIVNSLIVVNVDLAKTGGDVAPINIHNAFTNNSTLIVRVKNGTKYYGTDIPFIQINGSTDATSKIIIEGNFTTQSGPCVKINSNANVLLKGSFETYSTSKGAIELTTSAANVKLQGLLKTGHTESITAAGAYSISVLPGSAANKAVGATVTEVGGTITVNAGY